MDKFYFSLEYCCVTDGTFKLYFWVKIFKKLPLKIIIEVINVMISFCKCVCYLIFIFLPFVEASARYFHMEKFGGVFVRDTSLM